MVRRRPGKYDPVFRAALRYFLDERGWSQKDFSAQTTVAGEEDKGPLISKSTVSAWISGVAHPSNQMVDIVCQVFGVRRSYFWEVGEKLDDVRREREDQDRRDKIRETQDADAIDEALARMDESRLAAFENKIALARKARKAAPLSR